MTSNLSPPPGVQAAAAEQGRPSQPRPSQSRPRRCGWSRFRFIAGIVTAAGTALLVLGLAGLVMFMSGMVPLSGLQRHVAQDLQKRLGEGWIVSASDAAIVRQDGHAALKISNAEFQHVSGLKLKAPGADIRYDPWSVLGGQVRITSIAITGVSMRAQVDADGALSLDLGQGDVAIAPQSAEDAPGLTERVTRAIAALLDNDAILPGLDRVALTDARVTLVAPDGTERVGLQNVTMLLERSGTGRTLRLGGTSSSGRKDIAIATTADVGKGRGITVAINAFQLDSLEQMLVGPMAAMLKGFPVTGRVSLSVPETGEKRMSGEIRLGPGQLSLPEDAAATLRIDEAIATFDADIALRTVIVPRLTVKRGATDLAFKASLARDASQQWVLSGEAAGQLAGEGADPTQMVERGALRIEGEGLRSATLTALELNGPRLSVNGSGRAALTPDGPEVVVRLNATGSGVRGLLAAWPPMISPIIRTLIVERVEAGTVETMALALDMPPQALRAARAGDPTPDEALRIEVAGRGVRFVVGPGLPKLEDMTLTANGTGRTLAVQASAARIDLPQGRQLALADGSFSIADTWAARPIGRAAFRSTGGVDALAALLALPALKEAAPGQVDPATIKGRVDLRNTLSLPLVDNVKAADVIIQSTGTIAGLASEDLLGGEKLEAGNLAVLYDRGALSLRGDARIAGTPAQIDIRQDARGVGEAVASLVVDQAMRQKRGLGFNGAVTGPANLRVVKPLGRKPEADPRFEIDLTRLAIDGILPGWTKAAGRAGRLSFVMSEDDDDGLTLNDIALDASPVMMRGKVSIDGNGVVQRAALSQFRLSSGDDARIDMRRDGATQRLTVRGQVLDARPFLRAMTGAGRTTVEPQGDVEIDLAVPILTGFNSEAIGAAALKLSLRGREMRQLELTGRIGRAPLSIQQARDGAGRLIKLRSDDGGGLFRFFDVYNRAYGGDLAIDARPTEAGFAGDIMFRDFTVRGEPALRRVIGEQFSQASPDGQRGARQREAGDTVPFARLKGSFVRTPTRFEIRDGVIWGNQIGISGQGWIDYARDRVDLVGTFVPGYALNNAFSNVPLIGPLLGGGQYEGLFAVNFRVNGPASAPAMTINPLSAIAPGILRRFVDPLGGALSGIGNQPPRPQP